MISLSTFTLFTEYFMSISVIYILIVLTLVYHSTYGLMLQKAVSEAISLVLIMSCYLIINDDLMGLNFISFHKSITNDFFSMYTKFLICFFSSIYFLVIADFLKEQKLISVEYLIILFFAVLGLVLMCGSNDLITAYLAIELSSLSFYLLASFRKTSSYSVESGIKYFITGAVSSSFFLLGSSFIYGITGTINFSDYADLFANSFKVFYETEPDFDYRFIDLGLCLILFSLFIKLALAPFHLWSLDVYEGSPTSSTIFFAVVPKLSLFVLLVRLCYFSFSIIDSWQLYSLWVGILSIFVGSFGGLKQKRLKTLLAYSSTSHMGYALLALSSYSFFSLQMFLYYMFIYMLSGLCLWFILLFVRVKRKIKYTKYSKELGDLALLNKSNSALAFALLLTMFSLAGIPPLVGFLAKIGVFLSVIKSFFYFLSLLIVFCSVVSTFYYIRVVKIVYFENLLVGKLYYAIKTSKVLILSILIFLSVFLFVNPTLVYLLNYKVVFSLFYI